MAKAYSVDLRWRVIAAVDGGESVDEVADRYEVTARTVWNWVALRRATGGIAPRKGAVGPKPKLEDQREQILSAIQASPSLTLDELRERLSLPGCRTTLWAALVRWGQSLKKSPVCR